MFKKVFKQNLEWKEFDLRSPLKFRSRRALVALQIYRVKCYSALKYCFLDLKSLDVSFRKQDIIQSSASGLNLSLCCSMPDRSINQGTSCWGKEQRLYQKVSRPRRWANGVPNKYFIRVRIQAALILKGEGRVVGCCKHLGVRILCSCNYAGRSGREASTDLQ